MKKRSLKLVFFAIFLALPSTSRSVPKIFLSEVRNLSDYAVIITAGEDRRILKPRQEEECEC